MTIPEDAGYASQVSVVITHYRALDDLTRCLIAIGGLPGVDRLEVLVADSDAQEGTELLIRHHLPGVKYLPFDFNCGYAALVNAGLTATSRPYVMVMNADIELQADTLPGLVDHLRDNPDVGITGPAVTFSSGHQQTTAFAFYRPSTIMYRRTPLGRTRWGRDELDRFELPELVRRARSTGTPLDVDWLMGAALMVRRSSVLDAGPLDEKYFLYFEDVEWCLQFWRAGWRVVYLPTVACVHRWTRASKKGGVGAFLVNPLTRRHIRSSLRFFRKNGIYCQRPSVAKAPQLTSVASPIPIPRSDEAISRAV